MLITNNVFFFIIYNVSDVADCMLGNWKITRVSLRTPQKY